MTEIAGLKLIVPSSVTGSGVSVSASGKVTFTAATSISVNGCFSSTYDNYLVVFRGTTDASRTIRMRLVSGVTSANGSDYITQRLDASSTSVTGTRTTASSYGNGIILDSGTMGGCHIHYYGPYLSQPTAVRTVTVSNTSAARITDHAWTHSLSTSYDGLIIYTGSTEVMTGSLCVYGLSQ